MTTFATPDSVSQAMTPYHGYSRLAHLGVIRAQGADAAKFLHGQLTQDTSLLPMSEARLAGYCSAKGRLLASFICFKQAADDILLICDRTILAATLKRLSMFVLRAACKLSDASAEWEVWGVMGNSVAALAPELPPQMWRKCSMAQDTHTAHVVRLSHVITDAGTVARALCVKMAGSPSPMPELPASIWQWLEVCSGIAPVTAPLVDALVPQMLNYESVGGVNFKKGCYPGQEVVARSQFRGTLKRRTYLVTSDAALQVGQEVFHPKDSEQPCGLVVAAADAPQGASQNAHWALIAVQTNAIDEAALQVPAATARLQVLPLPYPLLEDI
ncbi:MAG: hypothetical protein RLZZ612_574 [Pseudomonadota bacterium]